MAIVNYAIGDVHGKIAMLDQLLDVIDDDIASNYTTADDITVIFLGDYVDRGEASKAVLDRVRTYDDYTKVALLGNHEDMMMHSLGKDTILQRESLRNWMHRQNGGFETLLSFGIPLDELKEAVKHNFIHTLRKKVGSDLIDWLHTLPRYYESELAIYVHACIEPDKPMDEQNPDVLIWSRSPSFMSGNFSVGKPVVHGHTPQNRPARMGNRIGVDTGAVYGGTLSALVLDSDGREEFFSVS